VLRSGIPQAAQELNSRFFVVDFRTALFTWFRMLSVILLLSTTACKSRRKPLPTLGEETETGRRVDAINHPLQL
jgi:hypothetical protein